MFAGHTRSQGVVERDAWILRLDNRGKVVWQQVIGGPFTEKVFGISATEDGGVVIAGKTYSAGTAISTAPDDGFFIAGISQERTPRDSKSSIIRLARDGRTVWRQLSENTGSNEAWGAAPTADRGVVVVSAAQHGGLGESNARLVRFTHGGKIVWSRLIGGRTWERPTSVITNRDGGILVAGYTTGRGAGYQDVWVIRLDGDGRVHRR